HIYFLSWHVRRNEFQLLRTLKEGPVVMTWKRGSGKMISHRKCAPLMTNSRIISPDQMLFLMDSEVLEVVGGKPRAHVPDLSDGGDQISSFSYDNRFLMTHVIRIGEQDTTPKIFSGIFPVELATGKW